jgi:dephospho-CoA kinase
MLNGNHLPRKRANQLLMRRSAFSESAAKALLATQMPAALNASKADVVIDTDCELKNLRQKIKDSTKSIKR